MMDTSDIDSGLLQLTEIILTANVINGNTSLVVDDLPVYMRPLFCTNDSGVIDRPVVIKEETLKICYPKLEARKLVQASNNSFIVCNDIGHFSVTTPAQAMKWYLRNAGVQAVMANPALALSYETSGELGISYKDSRASTPLFKDTVSSLNARIDAITSRSAEFRNTIDLVVPYAPEEVEFSLDDLVCTPEQLSIVQKVHVSLENREYLRSHRIYELGRILLVGPPGTGKTSFALALSRSVHMPVLEVRLSMLTSQYLGETSKNIDRIFELAKMLSPCILFIDEFDYIAKSRIEEENGTMKRAVNTLLKSIDHVNLVKDQVLLIGATNHASMLDNAAWRRFDETVMFNLPNTEMRKEILEHIAAEIPCAISFDVLAERTEGFSGADLRMMLTEAIVSALLSNRKEIYEEDINSGMALVNRRNNIRDGCQ